MADARALRGKETNVVDAYEAGQTVEEIAARNGCSVAPVQHLLAKAGVEPPALGDPVTGHEAAIAAAYVSGVGIQTLTRRFGCTTQAVRRVLASENVL